MSFPVLTIRAYKDADDDGRLYPALAAPGADPVVALEPLDGTVTHTVAKAVAIQSSQGGAPYRRVARVTDVRLDVYVTDARIVLACPKYDKGGGWFGGPTALALNAASMTLAAVRRHGKVLVGQVRYPWLAQVGASSKAGMLDEEQLRLVLHQGGTPRTSILVDLSLPKGSDSTVIAQDVAARAARYRLAHDPDLADDERATLEALATAERLRPAPKKFSFHTMPTYFVMSPSTAYPKAG